MKANSPLERLYNGIIKENPTFVLMLGMCPTLAVTTSAKNGFGMGMTTMVILALSNLMISMLRKNDSGQCAYAGLYRSRCIVCNYRTVLITGIYPESLRFSGNLYSIDRSKTVSFWDVRKHMRPRTVRSVLCLTESEWDLDLPWDLPVSVSSES